MSNYVVKAAHGARRRLGLAGALGALVARLAMLVAVERKARPSARAEGSSGGWRDAQGTRSGAVSSAALINRALR